jgi:hypothetical protein
MGNLPSKNNNIYVKLPDQLSLLESQPDDHLRHTCSFLNYKDVINLKLASKRFKKVDKYIKHFCYYQYECKHIMNDVHFEIINNSSLESFSLNLLAETYYSSTIEQIEKLINCLPGSLKIFKLINITNDNKLFDAILLKLVELQKLYIFQINGYGYTQAQLDKLETLLNNHPSIEKYDMSKLRRCDVIGGIMSLIAYGPKDYYITERLHRI